MAPVHRNEPNGIERKVIQSFLKMLFDLYFSNKEQSAVFGLPSMCREESRSFFPNFIRLHPVSQHQSLYIHSNQHFKVSFPFQRVILDPCIWFPSIFQQQPLLKLHLGHACPQSSPSASAPDLILLPSTEQNPFLCCHNTFSRHCPFKTGTWPYRLGRSAF